MSSAYFNFSTMFFSFALFVWIENNHDDNTEPWGATLLEITSSEKHSSFPSWLCSRACWPRQRLRLPFTSSGESRRQRNMILFCFIFCKLFITRAETHNCLDCWLIWRLFFFFFKRCPVELLNTSSTTIQQCFFYKWVPGLFLRMFPTHVPAIGLPPLHWSTGGGQLQRGAEMCHQRLWLFASQHGCKQWRFENFQKSLFYEERNSQVMEEVNILPL